MKKLYILFLRIKLILNNFFVVFHRYIEIIARDVDFKKNKNFFNFLLTLISILYNFITKIRLILLYNFLLWKKIPCKTICIGNLVAGGAGKTPVSVYIANLIRIFLKKKVVIISRGYKGKLIGNGSIVSDGIFYFQSVENIGDEPYLMSYLLDKIPVIIGKNRYKVSLKAINNFKPDIIIFDDSFQHLKIKYDLSFVLLNGVKPFGNGYLIPRGILRESYRAINRANAIIFTKNIFDEQILNYDYFIKQFSCFHRLILRRIVGSSLSNNILNLFNVSAVSFSGIVGNDSFFLNLINMNFCLKSKIFFKDHNQYSLKNIYKILHLLVKTKSNILITTDKDYVKFKGKIFFSVPLLIFGVEIDFNCDKINFFNFMSNFIYK